MTRHTPPSPAGFALVWASLLIASGVFVVGMAKFANAFPETFTVLAAVGVFSIWAFQQEETK